MPTSKWLDICRRCLFDDAVAAVTATPAMSAAAAAAKAMRLDTQRLPFVRLQDTAQPVLEIDLRLPAEQLPGPGDVGLADLRVVDGQRFEDDLALRARHPHDRLRKLEQRQLLRV